MSGFTIASSSQSGSNSSESSFTFPSASFSSLSISTCGLSSSLSGDSFEPKSPFGSASSSSSPPSLFGIASTTSPPSVFETVGSFSPSTSGYQPVHPEVRAITAQECDAQVSLRILIDKEKNRVLFAEAGKDFVDVLLSFLTLPLGTIARLVCKDSNAKPVKVGSLSSLYGSVKNLDGKHFWTETLKDMLLQPRDSMEAYCRHLKLNIDDTNLPKYFICQNWNCSRRASGALLSTSENKICSCGNMMNQVITLSSSLSNGQVNEGYVQETIAFIISDDLMILPDNLQTSVNLLKNLGIVDMDVIGEITVNVGQKEVLDLLKSSLLSKTPMTDIFLRKKELLENTQLEGQFSHLIDNVPDSDHKHMNVKVMLRKSNGKILFAQSNEDFIDFLFSFLTFPLGGVEHMLGGTLCAGTLDKIYKSVADLHANRHFRSEEVKNLLLDPRIDEACPNYSCYSFPQGFSGYKGYLTPAREYSCNPKTNEVYAPLTLIDPKSSSVETASPVEFVKGPALYMVTDDLVVTPISSISAATFLSTSKIPLTDLEEREVSIGVKEGLSILKASLISSSALTIGLGPFIKAT